PSPGDEDLLVLYYPQQAAWEAQCAAMDAAGFLRVTAFNPYWEVNGVTFVDRDGYRTVLQNRAWGMVCDSSGMAAS
ncbi:prolyl endopeptidase, partial [Klebsiella pneumoniae]